MNEYYSTAHLDTSSSVIYMTLQIIHISYSVECRCLNGLFSPFTLGNGKVIHSINNSSEKIETNEQKTTKAKELILNDARKRVSSHLLREGIDITYKNIGKIAIQVRTSESKIELYPPLFF